MNLFLPDTAHWYRPDGIPVHFVLSAKGAPRPTTVCDARKLGLLPSVTNVLGVVAKPELAGWKMEQVIMAALTLPRNVSEGLDEHARRVVEDSQSRNKAAMAFGTSFHEGAELAAKSTQVDPAGPCAAWLGPFNTWFHANCVRLNWTERVLVNLQAGYAGTADLLMEHPNYGPTLVDYKTQGVKAGAKARAYPSWCYQLAAYRRALGEPVACLNLIVDSTAPGSPVEHVWSEDQLDRAWRVFEAALVIWKVEKNYNPVLAAL